MPFTINTEIDLGHLLTFLTILGGTIAWMVTHMTQRKREKDDYAHSGALRLILRLLRDKNEPIASATDLYTRFQGQNTKTLRIEYCRKNFLFKDRRQFDAALYRLDLEGKVDFDGSDMVVYIRLNKPNYEIDAHKIMELSEIDTEKIYQTFVDGFSNTEVSNWDLRNITRVANQLCPELVHNFLRNALDSKHWNERARATEMIEVVMSR